MQRDVPLQVVGNRDASSDGMRQGLLRVNLSDDSDGGEEEQKFGEFGGVGGRGRAAPARGDAGAAGMRRRVLAEKLMYIGRGIVGMPPPERVGKRDEGRELREGASISWAEVGQDMSGWGGGWGGGDGSAELESLDFDTVNNAHWADRQRKQPRTIQGFVHTMMTSRSFYRWLLTILIGVGVAITAQTMQILISLVIDVRNTWLQSSIVAGQDKNHVLLVFGAYNLVCVTIGAILTAYLEPTAAADGIAEIKAYLNGSHARQFSPPCQCHQYFLLVIWKSHCNSLPSQPAPAERENAPRQEAQASLPHADALRPTHRHLFGLRAVIIRYIGSVLSVGSGLVCGPEGPMIHIGAAIASGVTRADKLYSNFNLSPSVLASFHNDRDRREFICAGAGAGMAAAFGAPIGGVLFALEEAASHWSPQLIWRVFTAALISTFTLALVKARGNSGA